MTKSKPEPRDINLYNKVKKVINRKYKPSAYRSGHLVKQYKKQYNEKYQKKAKKYKKESKIPKKYKNFITSNYKVKNAYKGNRTPKKGLKRWFDENWTNQRGEIGYKYKSDVYRPQKKINDKTPLTHSEITKKELKRARKTKARKGRIKRFRESKTKGSGNSKKSKSKKSKSKKSKTKKDNPKKDNPKEYKTKAKKKLRGRRKQKKKYATIHFVDYPEFQPNLTPREIFKMGSFGGTYWRPIKSKVTGKKYKNIHKTYPKSWFKGIPKEHLVTPFKDYDKTVNKHGVKVGTTLEYWESKGWIKPIHPYGWVHWYFDFYQGIRSHDDERQINRWKRIAGKSGRFTKFLITQIKKKKTKWYDTSASPAIWQTLQHWAYVYRGT